MHNCKQLYKIIMQYVNVIQNYFSNYVTYNTGMWLVTNNNNSVNNA